MPLFNELQKLSSFYTSKQPTLAHNQRLFQMYEGNLLDFILKDLCDQLSDKSFALAKHRVAPINILIRLIDKLSKIYIRAPKRTIIDGNDNDKALLEWYEENMQIDSTMNQINELFNLHKSTTMEPFLENRLPRLRGVPADRSLWYSNDTLNPVNPTHWIKFLGEMELPGRTTEVKFIYSDKEFLIVDSEFKVIPELMAKFEVNEGLNPFGRIPAIYINRSLYSIVPPIDTDLERMVKIFPIMLSDLNFAVMMQSFSITYGIDVDDENLTMSPNAFWSFKSDKSSKNAPQIGIIKPQVDIGETIQFLEAQLQLWLNSRSVRAGTIGGAGVENRASGISKIIDESDTTEDRQKQVQFFKQAEEDFWELITKTMHPYWRKNKLIDTTLDFSSNMQIKVEFPEQIPLSRRADLLDEVLKELNGGLTLPEIAIQRLNPGMAEDEALELLEKIKESRTIKVEVQETDTEEDDATEENPIEDGDNLNASAESQD